MSDLISRQAAIDALTALEEPAPTARHLSAIYDCEDTIKALPSAQPEPHEIGYSECANSMLKMWIDNVLTDGEYNHIMDRLNAHHNAGRRRAESEDKE